MPKSMSVVREAIAGDEADDAMVERVAAGQAKKQVKAGRKVLPIVEGVVLVAALLAPLVLQDYLTVFATRVIILALFALSFDLVWGYAGIMSFGQACSSARPAMVSRCSRAIWTSPTSCWCFPPGR